MTKTLCDAARTQLLDSIFARPGVDFVIRQNPLCEPYYKIQAGQNTLKLSCFPAQTYYEAVQNRAEN